MAKHASLSANSHLRLVSSPEAPSVQVSLPMLEALQSAKQGSSSSVSTSVGVCWVR